MSYEASYFPVFKRSICPNDMNLPPAASGHGDSFGSICTGFELCEISTNSMYMYIGGGGGAIWGNYGCQN